MSNLEKKAMSLTRKLMILALLIHLVSLFLLYQDEGKTPGKPMLGGDGSRYMHSETIKAETGFQHRPYAKYLIAVLLIIYVTPVSEHSLWKKYGYWLSLILLICFATGGSIISTSGGNLSLISLILVLFTAWLNGGKEPAKKPVVAH